MTTTHIDAILQVTGLAKRFNLEAGFFSSFGKFVYAVNGVSFAVKRYTALGLVGESGCGKTSTDKEIASCFTLVVADCRLLANPHLAAVRLSNTASSARSCKRPALP